MLPVPWYIIIVLSVVAFLSCSIGAVAGFAGGVFIVPLYTLILSYYEVPVIAIIGSSAAGVFFTGLTATILTLRHKEIDWLLALIFEIPTGIATYLGAFLTTKINDQVITTIFACFAMFFSILLFLRLKKEKEVMSLEEPPLRKESLLSRVANFGPKLRIYKADYSYTINIILLVVSGLLIGFLAGLIGSGCGWAKTPVLIAGFYVPPQVAVSTSLLMTTITLLISGITHIIYGHFLLWLWIIIASGSLIGSFVGTMIKRRISGKNTQIIIAVTLIVISIMVLLQTWVGF